MKPTVLMVPRLPAIGADRLREEYDLLGPMASPTPDALPPGAERARAMVTMGSLKTTEALISALPALELVSVWGTGYDAVDRPALARRGIRLSNAGDANAPIVAEMAMGLVLATTRLIAAGDRYVRAGRWKGNAVERMPIMPGLAGKRLGIYGLGAIGTRVAARAAPFEVEIGYHNRRRRDDVPYAYFDNLLALAEWSDVLVVAVRAGAENKYSVNAEVLRALGHTGHLVNISRGIAVDTSALCDALEARSIAGAALDVFENEPEVPDRLKALDNVVLTPHLGANTQYSHVAQARMMLDNVAAHFAGRRPPGLVED
ncbi:2-hydroxyacid dehydrogenase [Muricoccus radiodurans]|uniref:2-hydroxyacid dehydrogenase n=1 Tax=Muricoccus radiodurans TaxID=2231721 RepID=UPI003CF22B9C